MERIDDASPRFTARMAGTFFLLTIMTGLFAQGFVSNRLVVSGDAAATATNILTHRRLFQWGFAVYMLEMASDIAMTAFFYELFKPVSRNVSLLSAFLSLAGCAIKTLSRLFYFAPLLVLGGARYLSVFNEEQLQALALLLLNVNDIGAGIALIFFGFSSLLRGYLIVRSTFLPPVLGVLAGLGGLGWLAFLSPPIGNRLFPYIALVGLVGAVANIFWLIVFGVNEQRWREQALGSK
jgi:hypothetical protein